MSKRLAFAKNKFFDVLVKCWFIWLTTRFECQIDRVFSPIHLDKNINSFGVTTSSSTRVLWKRWKKLLPDKCVCARTTCVLLRPDVWLMGNNRILAGLFIKRRCPAMTVDYYDGLQAPPPAIRPAGRPIQKVTDKVRWIFKTARSRNVKRTGNNNGNE